MVSKGGKREGAGRPPEYGDNALTRTIKFRCSEDEEKLIKHKAHKRGKSVGRYIVELVKEGE
jgi:uncharacterized protein (DUF1778 family)